MLCILENGALQKDAYLCIAVRVGDMTEQGSKCEALLSSTCSIAKCISRNGGQLTPKINT